MYAEATVQATATWQYERLFLLSEAKPQGVNAAGRQDQLCRGYGYKTIRDGVSLHEAKPHGVEGGSEKGVC